MYIAHNAHSAHTTRNTQRAQHTAHTAHTEQLTPGKALMGLHNPLIMQQRIQTNTHAQRPTATAMMHAGYDNSVKKSEGRYYNREIEGTSVSTVPSNGKSGGPMRR